jgi:hexosaminidase
MDQRKDDVRSERAERRLFKEVVVHIDFKGAPPTFSFLKDFITYIGTKFEKVVTGILFEFEDTFPYDGNLKPLRGPNVYSVDQLKEVMELMRKHELKFIPLIQTFGHLEFVLKRERFSHLRE